MQAQDLAVGGEGQRGGRVPLPLPRSPAITGSDMPQLRLVVTGV